MTAVAMIGLDWGISALRAYALDAAGRVLRRHGCDAGILRVPDGAFEAALRAEIGEWIAGPSPPPIVAAGMITSRQGWVETPYVPAPAGAGELVAGLVRHRSEGGLTLHFVPGVERIGRDGVPDVMRGEETQIVGAAGAAGRALLVLPGSHSKWALVEEGRITWFATFMTGELYAALTQHTILGRPIEADGGFDAEGFAAGLALARAETAESGGLLRRLFSARTLYLFDRLPARGIADYLSGLLLGSEIAEARRCLDGRNDAAATIVGGAALAARYARALEAQGFAVTQAPADVAAAGLHAIACAAGLLGPAS